MHEFMDKDLCLFTIVQFVKPFSIYFDDICHGETRDFMKDFTKAPNAGNRAGLCVETPDTIYAIFLHMAEFYLFNKHINPVFDLWRKYIFHKKQ